MEEIFTETAPDPGNCFYTIREADVGKTVIRTTAGPVRITGPLGLILTRDVGKRLYRVPVNDGSGWTWQAESASQRDARLAPGNPEGKSS